MSIMNLKLKDLRAKHLSQRITVEGNVSKTSTQYPFCTKAAFQCMRCGHLCLVGQDSLKLKEPFSCENDTCGKKGPFKLITEESTFIDVKEIEIVDISDNITNKYEDPKRVQLKVLLIGDTVETKLTDQKFKFTGKFTTSEIGRKLEYLMYAENVEEVPTVESQLNDIANATNMSQRNKIKILKDIIIKVSARHSEGNAPKEEVYAEAEKVHGIDRIHAEENIRKMLQRGDLSSSDQKHVRVLY
jgi:DNA replicative helicase MCM subunit Mcm2 (Cdc46/Mcm family)